MSYWYAYKLPKKDKQTFYCTFMCMLDSNDYEKPSFYVLCKCIIFIIQIIFHVFNICKRKDIKKYNI